MTIASQTPLVVDPLNAFDSNDLSNTFVAKFYAELNAKLPGYAWFVKPIEGDSATLTATGFTKTAAPSSPGPLDSLLINKAEESPQGDARYLVSIKNPDKADAWEFVLMQSSLDGVLAALDTFSQKGDEAQAWVHVPVSRGDTSHFNA